jgi:uncharacterized protein YecT (DUF1311 family)
VLEAVYAAEKEYDKLLNKYYQILLNKMKDIDREVLRETQRNWIQFRDSEKSLAATLTKDHYTGGGSMYKITLAFEILTITKRRVNEIYHHISRFHEYEY